MFSYMYLGMPLIDQYNKKQSLPELRGPPQLDRTMGQQIQMLGGCSPPRTGESKVKVQKQTGRGQHLVHYQKCIDAIKTGKDGYSQKCNW